MIHNHDIGKIADKGWILLTLSIISSFDSAFMSHMCSSWLHIYQENNMSKMSMMFAMIMMMMMI